MASKAGHYTAYHESLKKSAVLVPGLPCTDEPWAGHYPQGNTVLSGTTRYNARDLLPPEPGDR